MTTPSAPPARYDDLRALKVGGVLVTGNEDGIKHVAMGVLYAL